MLALFDFDEAYNDWKGLKKERDEVTDPLKGMVKRLKCIHHYAMLLPVPDIEALKAQALNKEGMPWGGGVNPCISIELLFFQDYLLGSWFTKQPTPGGGEIIHFTGNKIKFAKQIVPVLDDSCFEIFRPMFDFIQSKCECETA